eukprot:TRINITY_DN28783_c0_g1_i1.p2 TRINITY_DN28783_c0_g1~~TRINITY_DN28783_c0_g1_i1.p2  ORF type:complete len:278 (+),score=138.98 TRINITY_DN28783_c0_g1_i1:54-836(+)
MEILIILVIMVVAAALVYMQLQGTKPEVVPVMDLPRKKKSPKAATVERKVVENWDKEESKSASPSPDGKKKGAKKRFDPVKAGQEMVAQKKVEESTLRERKHTDETEIKKEEKKARKQGFVMVEEKKVAPKRVVPVETTAEDEPMNETVARLRAILSGNKPDAPREFSDKPKPKPDANKDHGPISHDRIAEKLEAQKAEKKKKLDERLSANKGGKIVGGTFTAANVQSGGKSWASKLGGSEAKEEEAEPVTEEAAADDEE